MSRIGGQKKNRLLTPRGGDLTGLDAHDGRKIIIAEGFEDGGLIVNYSSNHSIDTTMAYQGAKCSKIATPGVAPDEDAWARIHTQALRLGKDASRTLRASLLFLVPHEIPDADIGYIEWWLALMNADETDLEKYVITLKGNGTWKYTPVTGDTAFDTQPDFYAANHAEYIWHHLEWQVNYKKATYDYILVDRSLMSIPGVAAAVTGSGGGPNYILSLGWGIGTKSASTAAKTMYIDNLIVSIGE